jgi:uncharacterized protein YjbJ (UPF0337 family)
MNKDQIKGESKVVAGKVQQGVGKVVGSTDQQRKGINKQIEGHVQRSVGDVEKAFKDTSKKLDDE